MAENTVTVHLRHSVGLRNGPLYGPGVVEVPESFARALRLDPVSAEEREEGGADELPEDFPGREHLVAAGLTTVDAVQAKSDEELIALDGIGEATVRRIREAR